MKKNLIQRCTVMTLLIVVLFTGFSQTAFTNILEKGYIQDLILKYVKEVYIDTTSEITLLDGAIQGMIEKLDAHSSYMPPITADEFNERIRGNFEGIGITFSILDHKITVIEVIEGGPSEAEGLKSRDKIVKINGESALDFTAATVKKQLRGHKGTKVTVHVERPGENRLIKFTITRDAVKLNSVSHAYMLDMKTGYIVVTKFTTKTDEDVLRALNKLDMQGMKQLVLDLRNNSGGSLEAAVNVVDFFISYGLIVETKGKRKRDNYKWTARKKPAYENIPMIVLINHGSASASEIVAGALQDHDRALIVGQTSFGKGLVMNQFPLKLKNKNLGTLILSVAKYYTPSGRLIQRSYRGSREEYIKEGFDDIDPNAPDSSKTGKPVYYTDLGREVYGGGGITPDKNINSLPSLNKLEGALRRTNHFFEFADGFLLRNNDIPGDFNEFLFNYRIPEDELLRFKEFIVNKGITIDNASLFSDELKKLIKKYDLPDETAAIIEKSFADSNIDLNETLFEKSIHFIKREIKQEIARMTWGSEARYKVWHTDDTELIGALSFFEEADALLKRRIAVGNVTPRPSKVK